MRFGVTPGLQKVQNLRVGGRACTQLFDSKNKALVYLYLDSLLPLRYGGFYMQPGGSSLRPAAGFKGSASAADLFFCILVSIIHGIWDGA